jgi:imidazolonepropionase-like amidohydrolase
VQVTSAPAPLKKPEIVGNAYKAAYHYVECESTYVVEPANTAETADAVRYFVQEAAARKMPLKIRASRRQVWGGGL